MRRVAILLIPLHNGVVYFQGHTFNIDCGLPEFTDFSTIAGNVPKVFDNVTARVQLDQLSLSGYGLTIIECHVTSCKFCH